MSISDENHNDEDIFDFGGLGGDEDETPAEHEKQKEDTEVKADTSEHAVPEKEMSPDETQDEPKPDIKDKTPEVEPEETLKEEQDVEPETESKETPEEFSKEDVEVKPEDEPVATQSETEPHEDTPVSDVVTDDFMGDLDDIPDLVPESDVDIEDIQDIPDTLPELSEESELDQYGNIDELSSMEVKSTKHIDLKDVFSVASMTKWISMLPPDVKKSIKCDNDEGGDISEMSGEILGCLRKFDYPSIISVIKKNYDNLNSFGRARRIRLLALMSSGYIDSGEDEASGGSLQEIGILFLEDLKYMSEHMIAPRLTHAMMNENNLSYANQAISDMTSENVPGVGGSK